MRWLIIFVLGMWCVNAHGVELSISVNSSGETKSCVTGRFHGILIVQQFRWLEWRNVDTVGINQQWSDSCILGTVFLHSGENQIRLVGIPTNPYMESYKSAISAITTSTVCNFDGKCNHIGFTVKTIWEIRDQDGVLLRTGFSSIVNTDGLPKGGYFLYYDNKRSEFFKQ